MLAPILESTRRRLEGLPPLAELRERALDQPPARPFRAAIEVAGLSVVAEVKRRSPSRGALAPDLDPVDRAQAYHRGGAAAISVLTEPDHFSGSSEDLVEVRANVPLPVLRKDFTLVPEQVWEARAMGADAVLLIAAALDDDTMVCLADTSAEAGVAALFEIHDEPEAERVLALGPAMVGVNNRDLTTFAVDLGTAERLAPMLEGVPVTVAESGIHTPSDAGRMAASGYSAVLVGESLVRAVDPARAVQDLVGHDG
jgi:indole-3-glycerol phosphate synthase